MSSPPQEIVQVSDTALLVAACRALETERADAFVRDPFAARLAGERGMAIARALPHLEAMSFGIALRGRFMDELIADTIARHGIETVVSLGCGLDARPWRLDLPAGLRWIESDLPGILVYKAGVMASETPRCRLEQLAADLNDASGRRAVYEAAGAAPALLITEGLLMFLPAATIEALAAEISENTGIRHWLSDIITPALVRIANPEAFRTIRSVQAADRLDGLAILDVLARHGWTTAERRSFITDLSFAAGRIEAMMRARPQDAPPPARPPADDPAGVHLFSRA
jgi:methyltransferase (TIGR00027 family)